MDLPRAINQVIAQDDVTWLRHYLDEGLTVDGVIYSLPLLMLASWYGAVKCVMFLLEHGADRNEIYFSNTAMSEAVRGNKKGVVTILLRANATQKCSLYYKWAAKLFLAFEQDQRNLVRLAASSFTVPPEVLELVKVRL